MKNYKNTIKIYKTYADEEQWFEITEKEFISKTEGHGYFKKGTALQTLLDVGIIRTDFAYYSLKPKF
jgi:hypothetical protein